MSRVSHHLESQNIVFDQITPRAVIKQAFASKLITSGEDWMDALDTRNKLSHTYNFAQFENAIFQIEQRFLACIAELYQNLAKVLMDS